MTGKWLTAISFVLLTQFIQAQNAYQIKVTLRPFTSGYLYLGHHFGKKQYLIDSAKLNAKSEAIFKGKEKLLGGVYMIVYPKKDGWFEVLVDKQQNFSVTADTAQRSKNIQFINSPENNLFKGYQDFSYEKGSAISAEYKKLAGAKTASDSAAIKSRITALNKELQDYRENFVKQHPEHMLAAIFRLLKEPVVPDASRHPGGKYDSAYAYQYYKSHFWDGVSFADERLIRTPVFLPKLEKYFTDVLPQDPDSLIKAADEILNVAQLNKESFKVILSTLTDKYINPAYMGQDKVFVHLFQKYYVAGQADYWISEKYRKFLFDRGYSLMANVIGEAAANMELIDTSGKPTPLYKVQAPYTIVCFWDPTCSHCQVEVPKLDSLFQQKWKSQGVQMYGVMTDGGKEAWLKYIREHNLKDWVHVYQTQEMKDADYAAGRANFRQLYDVYQTPMLYLLDKDKHIIAKKLNYEQLNDFLDFKLKKKQSN